MKFIIEFLYSFGPNHIRKIKTEMILAAFNIIYITGLNNFIFIAKAPNAITFRCEIFNLISMFRQYFQLCMSQARPLIRFQP